ncbi:MAG TPA: hypothetical protein VHU80_11235 [Polyangiaceae bacterium]|jgi:hypothetical protein|nr:hypothetical protein [Polyangiaceae bacterium]
MAQPSQFDALSTAAYFDGFTVRVTHSAHSHLVSSEEMPVVPAKTWLLHVGWRRHGLIAPHEAPA